MRRLRLDFTSAEIESGSRAVSPPPVVASERPESPRTAAEDDIDRLLQERGAFGLGVVTVAPIHQDQITVARWRKRTMLVNDVGSG
jgi:hypothetical protein